MKADLLQLIGSAVGYHFSGDYLKRQICARLGYAQTEQEMNRIRQALVTPSRRISSLTRLGEL